MLLAERSAAQCNPQVEGCFKVGRNSIVKPTYFPALKPHPQTSKPQNLNRWAPKATCKELNFASIRQNIHMLARNRDCPTLKCFSNKTQQQSQLVPGIWILFLILAELSSQWVVVGGKPK